MHIGATGMSTTREQIEGISLQNLMLQMGLLCMMFYLWSSPALHPIKLMVVLFHEMSHGLMAILTGGDVVSIVITSDEGGACETAGGLELAIISAGYLGAMFVGGMILYLSRAKHVVPVVYGMLTLVLVAAVATVLEDEYSRTFASCLAGAFIFHGFVLPAGWGALFLRAIGTFACVYSLFDIYWDVLAEREGPSTFNDAVAFSEITGFQPQAVGMAWMLASVVFLLVVLKFALTAEPDGSPSQGHGQPASV